MRNLIYHYYIPYRGNDADMGGKELPDWALAGSRNAERYATKCGAEYVLDRSIRRPHLDPRLESVRVFLDEDFDEYDTIVSIDLDMLFLTNENIFDIPVKYIGMVHELGVHDIRTPFLKKKLENPGAAWSHAKSVFPNFEGYPKSSLYPKEKYRYLNGGLQIWTKEGRLKARELFTPVEDYFTNSSRTEQPYINNMLAGTKLEVTELPREWNSLDYQWGKHGMGKLAHFLNRTKFRMPGIEKDLREKK